MPFKSKKQRKWMHANKPKMAKKWEKESTNEAMSDAEIKKMHKKYKETGELPPHLKKMAKDLDKFKVKHKVKNIVVPGLEWMSKIKESTAAYKKSLEKIARDRQLKMLSKKDKETLIKIATMMKEGGRDYKAEYKKFQSSTKSKKYRAELNKYNRKKGTYGNGDGKDASHKGGKIVGFEAESKNRGRAEKSRMKKESQVNELVPPMSVSNPAAYKAMLDKQISKNVKVKTALGNKDHKDHGKAKSLLKRFMDKFKKKKDEPKKSKSTPTSAADFRRSRKESVNENKKDAVYWQLVKNGNRPSEAKKILDKYYDKVSKMYKKASIQKKAEIISSLSGKNESVNERKFHSKKASDNYLGGLNSSKGDTEMFGDGKGKFYIWVKPKGKKEKYIDLPKSINDRSKADVFHKKIQKTMGESVEEGFGGDLKGEDKKKFEKARKANGEQLGYTLTGEGDIKESHTISFSKEEMSQLHNDGQIEKDGHTYVYTESVNEGFADKLTKKMKKHKGTKVTKLKLKGRGVYQKYDESDLPITTKKGKTIKAVHKTSGKEIVVVDTPSSRKKLKRMGFKVESVDEGQKRDSSNAYMKYYKTYETFAREVMNLAKTTTKLSGDRTDEKIILKNFKKYVIPFAGLMNSWDKGQQKNPHIDESVNEAITVAGYSELGKRGHNLPRAAKQFITALRKKDDREIEKYIDIIANLMKWMQTTLKNPRFNESVNETHHWSIEPSGVMAKINKIVQDKQHAKIGGVLVDMFSAGIMMQIYDKVNDKNKEQMNKGNIRQVQVVLNKVMKHNKITK